MAAQKGKLFLLKIGDAASPEVFTTLCGIRTNSFVVNNGEIDTTAPDCTTPGNPLWKTTLDGVKSVSVSGDGIFQDAASDLTLSTLAIAATSQQNFEIVVPDFGTYAGNFTLTSYETGASYDGEVTFSLSLENNGAVTFTAV